MRAQEFRIGNYLEVDGNFWRVDSIVSIGGYAEYELYFKENDKYDHRLNANPIPLTEEWLLKFGFEKNSDFVSEAHPWEDWVFNNLRISLPYFEFSFAEGDASIEIKYVHQLQNLFFALCGEELTIKEPIKTK